jgi:Fingers domain of DNA polymerase lambda
MELFMGIYGVGRNKAMQWIMQGLRTLKDVLDHGNVSENQRIGIELYDVSPRVNDVDDDRNSKREFQGRKWNDIVAS